MRLFTGIDVPYEIRRNLELLLHHLRPTAELQWSPVDNLHITTKFIGDWREEETGVLQEALAEVETAGPLRISVQGLGWFPHQQQPRVFFAGIQAYDGLRDLARATDDACARLGISPEVREYHPHLTLARIRRPVDLARLKTAIGSLPSTEFGVFTATHFHLYESKLRPGGSLYTKLASYALTK